MFTGIIRNKVKIKNSQKKGDLLSVRFDLPKDWSLKEGDSISTNGVCLTVTDFTEDSYGVQIMTETLDRSTFGVEFPEEVNLEQSATLSSRLDGHIVQGHVDTVAELVERVDKDGESLFTFKVRDFKENLVIEKGSITVNGVSLTITEVLDNGFSVSLVEYTLEHTTLGDMEKGDFVNIEYDMVAKYIAKNLENTVSK